jgi:hypothetical protein
LSLIGTKAEAEEIKQRVKTWLSETLMLELSDEKTLITHATKDRAKFLGYEVGTMQSDSRPEVNGYIELRIPEAKLKAFEDRYQRDSKVMHRAELINDSDFDIVAKYGAEFRGVVQYYKLARNIRKLGRVERKIRLSLLKTLANKHKTTVRDVWRRYKHRHMSLEGDRMGLRVVVEREGKTPLVAKFGETPLKRQIKAVIQDEKPMWTARIKRTELVQRLLAEKCELCGSTEDIDVHHVRALKGLDRDGRNPKPAHIFVMAARRRKTLVVCKQCHTAIHTGQLRKTITP